VIQAAENAAKLTRNLLAFSRKQLIDLRATDLNEVVGRMENLLLRLIGEDIELTWRPGARDPWVRIDPSQVDQLLANLAVNARDAIVGVGTLAIETANAFLSEDYCAAHAGAAPGEYIVMKVSDSGFGMSAETIESIFEPFFTTKPVGQGTGLGLSTVYGIVKQNEGHISVASESGKGTTFLIHLRRYQEKPLGGSADGGRPTPAGGGETILLVEDEANVRKVAARFLQRLGYFVLKAAGPAEAQRLAAAHAGPIHLLITDVIMPGMNGLDLAAELARANPGMRTLFISGYTADVIARQGVLEEGVQYLAKPFDQDALALRVRQAISGERLASA
jgi:CheY-like chemotaxis protein